MSEDRDQELDELVNDLNRGEPFIHRPDKMKIRDGLLCWLDGTRVCGSDCVAFNVELANDEGELYQGAGKCLVLLYAKDSAASSIALVAISKKARHDAVRSENVRQQGFTPPGKR